MSEDVEIAKITITRSFTDDDDVVEVGCSEGVSVLDGLGMLAMAMSIWSRTNGLRDEVVE